MPRYLLAALIASALSTAWGAGPDSKLQPGHYVALNRYDDGPEAIQDAVRRGVVGVQKRYTWRELEPQRGVYDFSEIEADLAVLTEMGRQLVVFVFDKSFQDVRYTPEYLWDEYTLPVNSMATGQGYVAKRWDPYVVERFSALMAELGRVFDGHQRFEGVAVQETALGVEDAVLAEQGYTPELYRDALIAMLRNAAAAMPRSRVFWYANFLPQGQPLLAEVADAVTPHGVAVGGPDVLPDRPSLQQHVYPLLRAQPAEVVVFNSAQNDSFRHEHADASAPTRYWTPEEILHYARDDLGVQYLFWNRVGRPNPADSYDIEDAYRAIAAHPLSTMIRPGTPVLAVSP